VDVYLLLEGECRHLGHVVIGLDELLETQLITG
jgi:hypothetical protein